MAARTWETRELPILEAIVAAEDKVPDLWAKDIAASTGLPIGDALIGVRALIEAGYVTGARAYNTGLRFDNHAIRPLESGRRATRQWPSDDAYAELLALLEVRIQAATGDDRGRLERLRDALVGVGRDVVTGVLFALGSGAIR